MGSNVPPMIPTRPPATERAYPGPSEPAPEDRPRPAGGGGGRRRRRPPPPPARPPPPPPRRPRPGPRRTGRPAPPCSRSRSGTRTSAVGRCLASDHVGTALSTRDFWFGYGVAPKLAEGGPLQGPAASLRVVGGRGCFSEGGDEVGQ